ncbi:MAG: hypothetical protein KKD77_21085 [Gammaproteobacteria bacterium]|nr:hypothetical protein [Gammaproteobacteria bacterium]
MAYCATTKVAALCRNLISNAPDFTETTDPPRDDVLSWLDSGYATINAYLATRGYDTPVAATVGVYDALADLNGLYAAARAEMSRSNVVLSPGERTRGQVFLEMFNYELERLCKMDLSLAGMTRSTSGKLYAGGISDADKDLAMSDTDRTTPRFSRGMFDMTGILQPAEQESGD